MGEKEYYFFCQRDRKYPTGMRTNRATESGYWKATGKDKEIYKEKGFLVGMKKTLVFYRGRAPKGDKSNWVMHEYRLEGKFTYYKPAKDEWVVCRIFHKNSGVKRSPIPGMMRMTSPTDGSSLPPLMDLPHSNQPDSSFNNRENEFKPESRSYNPMSTSSYLQTSNSMFYPQFQTQNPISHFQSHPNQPYLHQARPSSILNYPMELSDQAVFRALATNNESTGAGNKECKVEQFSTTHSLVASQETGISTDINNEISSVVSKQNMTSNRAYEDHDQCPSVGPIEDLAYLWDF